MRNVLPLLLYTFLSSPDQLLVNTQSSLANQTAETQYIQASRFVEDHLLAADQINKIRGKIGFI